MAAGVKVFWKTFTKPKKSNAQNPQQLQQPFRTRYFQSSNFGLPSAMFCSGKML
jgi:hypothetical protein